MLLSDFPQEILEQIADPLSFEDKVSCSLVCKSWKRAFQDFLYSYITIKSRKTFDGLINPSQENQHDFQKNGHLLRYLHISCTKALSCYDFCALHQQFPKLRRLYLKSEFGSMRYFETNVESNTWISLTELRFTYWHTTGYGKLEGFTDIFKSFPSLKRLEIDNTAEKLNDSDLTLNDLEKIHSHLKHLEYLKLDINIFVLSNADLELIPKVSPATAMRDLRILVRKTDYRWLFYFSCKYPNLQALEFWTESRLYYTEQQKTNTVALFQQAPISFQHLTKLNLQYFNHPDEDYRYLWNVLRLELIPLKHISICAEVPYRTSSFDSLYGIPQFITEFCLTRCPETIESFHLQCENTYTTPIDLMKIKDSFYNLVKLDIDTFASVQLDTFLEAAPRLKSLALKHANIKVKDELYSSKRSGLQLFKMEKSTITSNVLRFLSFHCRRLNILSLVDTSVHGNFTTPGCQFIDMTYSRLQSLYIHGTEFIIKDNKECPDNLNITLITRPVDDLPPKQDYDPNILPVIIGAPIKAYYDWFHKTGKCMYPISKSQGSRIERFVLNYEENKRITAKRALCTKRRKPSDHWKNRCAFGYTKIKLGYVAIYKTEYYDTPKENLV